MSKFLRESWLILLLGILFAGLLAGAQTSFKSRIEENQVRALNEAIGEVVPGTKTTEKVVIADYNRDVFRCMDDNGRLVGWAVDTVGMGFADRIRQVVGLSPDARIVTGLRVIENVETPGLGNKIAEARWADQYKGLHAGEEIKVEKHPPQPGANEIQAVTGATISSKAVTGAVNEALRRVRPEIEKLAAGQGS